MPNIGTSGSPAAGTAYYNLYKFSSELRAPSRIKREYPAFGCRDLYDVRLLQHRIELPERGCQAPTSGSCGSGLLTCNVIKGNADGVGEFVVWRAGGKVYDEPQGSLVRGHEGGSRHHRITLPSSSTPRVR